MVLSTFFIYILSSGPESWALMNILKKFFIIKTADEDLLEHPHEDDGHYKFKLSDHLKSHLTLMNSALCSYLPVCSKK